ncbi:MAG TPA: hypothetical protein EYN72_05335, partial [Dehalococcoidia bacterium]|nr:hypothetical protein [Dehalococcoidia bacterium]
MIDKIFSSMDEAVADISDGSTIMFPGFGNTGIPRNLMAALLTQGAKNLIGISNGSGGRDDRIDIGVLVRARQFKKLVMAFTASPHPSFSNRGLPSRVVCSIMMNTCFAP